MELAALIKLVAEKFGSSVTPSGDKSPWIKVEAGSLVDVARFCRDDPEGDFSTLSCLSGVDYPDRIELVYHLLSLRKKHALVLKVSLDRALPVVASVDDLWKAANWYERECYDLLGVTFTGHPDLRRLLLPDDWVGHPLRKDYVPPTEYHGMSHTRANPLDRAPSLAETAVSAAKATTSETNAATSGAKTTTSETKATP